MRLEPTASAPQSLEPTRGWAVTPQTAALRVPMASSSQAPRSLWRVGMDLKHSREPKGVLKVDLVGMAGSCWD